jgi:DNA replication initiation complex subunit (GINS family)
MYNELYEIWKKELENAELERLPADFYLKIVDYLRRHKEEGRMLDKKTVKANLLKREAQNVKRMVRELMRARYRKLVRKTAKGEKVPSDVLTPEEEKIYTGALSFSEAYSSFAKSILRGDIPKANIEQKNRRAVLRFFKNVPAIIGADMKTYGPFVIEDIASLPMENAKILIKQGLAEKVETS